MPFPARVIRAATGLSRRENHLQTECDDGSDVGEGTALLAISKHHELFTTPRDVQEARNYGGNMVLPDFDAGRRRKNRSPTVSTTKSKYRGRLCFLRRRRLD